MKRLTTVVFIMALLLVLMPWGIGKLAGRRVDSGLDQLVEAAPYLSIVERKYSPGWFRSEQEVTFEVKGPWMRALSPEAAPPAEDAVEAGSAALPAPEMELPVDDMPPHDRPADDLPSPQPASPQIAAPVMEPLRVTVRNEILHGPVLWFSGFGIARVHTRFVLPDAVRRGLIDTIGTDEPLKLSTSFGFFGGRTTRLTSEKRTVKLAQGREFSWDDLMISVAYSRALDNIDIVGAWPRFEMRSTGDAGERLLLRGLELDGRSERIDGDLYDTDFELGIDTIEIADSPEMEFSVRDASYSVDTAQDGDFVSVAFKVGSGALKNETFKALGAEVEEVHYDLTLRRLHTKTLSRLITAIKDSYSKAPTPGVSAEIAIFGPIKDQAFELLKYDPELHIDRIGIQTADGGAYIKGQLRCRGVTPQDLDTGGLALIAKLESDLKFEAPQKMLERIQGGAGWVNQMVDQGVLERTGSNVVSHLEFARGELKINGKVQGIPGLGGGPPPPQ